HGSLTQTTYFVRRATDAVCGTVYSNVITITVDLLPLVNAGPDDTICHYTSAYQIPFASVTNSMVYRWNTPDGSGYFDRDDIIDPVYNTGIGDLNVGKGGAVHFVLSAEGLGACSGETVTDTVVLTVAPELVASVGSPTPFYIGPDTKIEVQFQIEGRYLLNDLGFYLVSPDDSVVMLKQSDSPLSYCNWNSNVDITFRNIPEPADTIRSCSPVGDLTGVFKATGEWADLYGQDPANGVWKIVVLDYADFPFQPAEGTLTHASLSFTDLDNTGHEVTLYYDMAGSAIDVNNTDNAGIAVATAYNVILGLQTSCYESCDATAVVTPVGGFGPYQIEWSDGLGNGSTVQLCAGTYYVVVTDALGCTDTAKVAVESPLAIVIEDLIHTDTILCHGAPAGEIRTKADGGTGALTYTLMPGDMPSVRTDSGVFLNLTAGDYTVVITDANGCIKDTTVTIGQKPLLEVEIEITHVIGSDPGTILLTATGGSPPYLFSIDNGLTTQDNGLFEGLPVGTYEIYVEDANGCIFADVAEIIVFDLDVYKTYEDVTCSGLADASFILSVLDGIPPYTMTGSFLADPLVSNDGLFSFTGQTAGEYDLRIEDVEGRIYLDTIRITEPPEITSSAAITNAACSANTYDGSIALDVSGGVDGFSFLWSNGETTEDLIGIEAGSYTVVITDANNCQAEFYYEVQGDYVVTAYAGEDDFICQGTEYQLFGSAGDSVRWQPEAFVDNPRSSNPFASIQEGTPFVLTVYDNGCWDSDTVFIDVYESIGIDIYDPSGAHDIDSVLFLLAGESCSMAATEGFGTYLWVPSTYLSNPNEREVLVTPLSGTWYYVYGTSPEGCVESDSVHVIIAAQIEIFSGFSPNGDGINDTWVIKHAVEYGDRIRVQVFNRWGEPVFESKGYGGANEWDGTRNGRPMPVGVYYYIINVGDEKSEPYTGTVTLIR
ncbi:MAG: gliding motility-associated C-terminal domain-containing protein, partial [Bacteroidales bacterium]|nr:gliding motility-associated C-terminal domain-containing protein [Bacteroidales bacterium]